MARVEFTRSAPCGFLIVRAGGDVTNEADTCLIQTDWDYPGVASRMGWDMGKEEDDCDHSSTDGTVDCPDCGKTVSQFLSEALEFIRDFEGEDFEELEEYFGEN